MAIAEQGGSTPWWRGARGEWYVAGQVVLMLLVFFGPRQWNGWPARGLPLSPLCTAAGAVLLVGGFSLLVAGMLALGRRLTPLPHPVERGTLVESGPYRIVRHPMYGGGIVLALGWALVAQSLLTLAYVCLLAVFLDVKARREERWLVEKLDGYAGYRRHVRRFVPFVY